MVSEIFQYADHAQLPSIALTCRRYRPEAERLLYQRIEFYECDKHTRACLKALATTPQKALLVHSFWIDWRELQKKATLQLLGRALLAMKSLKVLHLRFFHNSFEPAQSVMNSFLKYALAPCYYSFAQPHFSGDAHFRSRRSSYPTISISRDGSLDKKT